MQAVCSKIRLNGIENFMPSTAIDTTLTESKLEIVSLIYLHTHIPTTME